MQLDYIICLKMISLDFIKKLKITVFTPSKTEKDELLWAYYANSHKGFCIEYDLEILLKIKSVNLNCIV
jgi:hypothetical protein